MEVAIIPGHPGPLVRRRQLGAALRRHRIDAGLSLAQVADELLLSPSKISRIETAQRSISARDVRDLMNLYRVTDPEARGELMKLVEESRETAWWARYNLGPGYERLIGLEGAAATICDYQLGTIPGLLQTPEYAAAVAGAWTDDPEIVRSAVEVRMARQENLSEHTMLKVVVDESAIRRSVGDRRIMRDQIRKLIDLNQRATLEFQVVPFSVGAHQGLITGFIVLQFSDSVSAHPTARVSDIVYHEGVVGEGVYIEQFTEVQEYLQVFLGLQQVALGAQETTALLEGVLRDI
ncbi:helix-turn-helix domain-containing protein [Actinoplanes subglobosus]|uniref:Helix-turn-helix domain-containing protein n=1 Tax=Actinoplanes subglobosus TaxID=1547892 RepID=A0ABV8IY72_9ACTN